MRIPQGKIEEVRNVTDIVDLIGGFVRLKKRGKNYVGLCPFHTEKTPSFNVSPERQMYHCFGCGVGGNAITFVMEYEKVSFVEAVRSLAERAGITLPMYTTEDEARASEQEQLYEVCKEAARFFHKCLIETPEGKFALEYFRRRGFSDETIRTFGLGYSPKSWDALVRHAESKKLAPDLLDKAGLARKRDDGTYFDYFHGRAMFPIFSPTGRVVAFGARKLYEDDQLGKYINSPETLVYNKSRIVYGTYQAKEAIREKDFVVLVEGYADLISVFQSGFRNVVASSGTALTPEQIQLISRYTKNITIMYDADSAGSKAALRGVDLILENDLDVRVAVLPEGEDPDTFVQKKGKDAFQQLLDDAVSFVDYVAQSYEREGKLETPEGQAQTVRAIVQSIARMNDELKRNFYIKRVAEKYRLYESTLHRELEKQLGSKRLERETIVKPASEDTDEGVEIQETSFEISTAERDLLHVILEGGREIVNSIFEQMTVDDFTSPTARALASLILQRLEDNESIEPSILMDEVKDDDLQKLIADLVFSKYQLSKRWEEAGIVIEQADAQTIARHAIVGLRRRALEKQLEENQRRLKEATRRGENVVPFLEMNKQLIEELRSLQVAEPRSGKTE